MILDLRWATAEDLRWAQAQVTAHHYLHAPVDPRCSVAGYVVWCGVERAGCLLFGRPEATRCYQDGLTYGSLEDVAGGRALYSRWEILNLARVWLDPRLQRGGDWHVPNAASWAIAAGLRRVGLDYLLRYPPCFLEQPWQIRQVLSYCDTGLHQGTVYRAANFALARTNAGGIQTWHRPLRPLQPVERVQVAQAARSSARSQRYQAARRQLVMEFAIERT